MEKTDKPKRRRAKKPLGSHPLGEKHMAAQMAELDRAKEWMADNKPFYTTPEGGEPAIPHEPPRMTIEDCAEAAIDDPGGWLPFDGSSEGAIIWNTRYYLRADPTYWDRARALGLLDDRL